MLRHLPVLAILTSVSLTFAAFAQETAPQAVPQPVQPQRPAPAAKPRPRPKPVPAKKPAAPAPPEIKAHLVQKIKDWTVFVYEGTEGRVCFAAAAPSDMQPKTVKRTGVIFYITTWQKDGVHNEVSVKQGYSMKANATATVALGGQSFVLTAEDDKIFVKEAASERQLLAALAGGGEMIVKATSSKGTATTDHYSLDGITEAVQKIQEICP
jgi:hypothetical protein